MRIEEIVRSCVNTQVAEAAVASIGGAFYDEVADRAAAYEMSVGAFTALSIDRFLRHGDEGELRSVVTAMYASQEPVLAGLHRILCIMLAASATSEDRSARDRTPCLSAELCALESDKRREHYA